MKYFYTLTWVITCLFLFGCQIQEQNHVIIQDQKVSIEIAKTPQEKQIGLMHRESLPKNHGMLFIWEKEDFRGFWMKNTLIPLDIIFIDKDLTIINIAKAVPCEEDPCQTYPSLKPAKYVLEVQGGWTDKHNVTAGEVISIHLQKPDHE